MNKSHAIIFALMAVLQIAEGQTTTPSVQSFTLINASTNEPITGHDPLVPGTTLNLATLPTRTLNIRANANPATVGSVRFTSSLGVRTETAPPYAMAGDTLGNYWEWRPSVGVFNVTAVAYTGASGTGTAGATTSISLNFIDQQPASSYSVTVNGGSGSGRYPFNSVVSISAAPAPMGKVFNAWTGDVSVLASATAAETAFPMSTRDLVFTATYKDAVATQVPIVTSLTLINTETSQPVPGFNPIINSSTLHLGTIATRKLNVRANTSGTVGSVKFVYTGGSRVESTAPYALAGDSGPTAYYAWTPAVGTLTITATPYSGPGATGIAGAALIVTITVQDSTTTPPPPPPPPPPTSSGTPEEHNGYVKVEAEAFVSQTQTSNRRWYLTTPTQTPNVTPDGDPNHAATASGAAYLEILPDTRRSHADPLIHGVNFSDTAGAVGVLNYQIKFNTPSRYYVWARIFSTTSEDNGMHVGLNGAWPASGNRMQWCDGKQQWYWNSAQRTATYHCGVPGLVYLDIPSAGVHTISFSMREDGVEFDAFILTTNPNLPRP